MGHGDVSPFIPRFEDDFLLFLPQAPSIEIPSWPDIVTVLNGVLLSQVDELYKLRTTDPKVMSLVVGLARVM